MRQTILQNPIGLAALVSLATITAGCGQATALKADLTTGPAVTRVEVVKPGRATIRRSTEEPGQIEAYEVTPIYSKVSGYVQKWNTDIGAKVVKGQVLAVLSVPELDAEAEQKMATVEETEAKLAQAKASEEVA
ncbi:MAG: biotin/lipoyl-binding protein, partial [Isosphaeraceae bacterium]